MFGEYMLGGLVDAEQQSYNTRRKSDCLVKIMDRHRRPGDEEQQPLLVVLSDGCNKGASPLQCCGEGGYYGDKESCKS